jgi:hypothetical protein
MKQCPSCHRTYTDDALSFCLEDGTPLAFAAPPADTTATIRYSPTRDTNAPPPSYQQPAPPVFNQPQQLQPTYPPMPMAQRPRRSNAIWWILGILVVLVLLVIGAAILIIAIASMSSATNSRSPVVVNTANRNTNNSRTNSSNANSNANTDAKLPSSFKDDFSEKKWETPTSQFGELWYANAEFHMRSKDKTYLIMFAPTNDYNTKDATVRVTARSVDGVSPPGYGLVVHFARSKDKGQPEDYAFLIDSSDKPQYRIVLHRGGTETPMVDWTPSSTIRTGTSPNQLEVRIKGALMGFYINGQYVTSINDTANFKNGLAGLYTSGAHEVAFDDMEFTR